MTVNRTEKLTELSDVINIFKEKPVWILPLLATITINIIIILYVAELYQNNIEGIISTIFLLLWFLSTSLIYACVVLLNAMKQYKIEENVDLIQTLWRLLNLKTILFVFLSLVWVIVGVILLIFELLFTNTSRKLEDLDFTLKVTAVNVSNGLSSIWALPLRFRLKATRQILFMILPVLIWEEKGLFKSYKRSKYIIQKQIAETIINPDATSKVGFIILVPMLGLIILKLKNNFEISAWYGWIALIYVVLLGSSMFYVDNIFMTDKYLRFSNQNFEDK